MFENGFPKHWSTLKKLIWLVGSGVAGGASEAIKTVSGAIVHILDALARPAISLKCEINPQQDLHGYDNPWPAGGGKNKFNGIYTAATINVSGGIYTYGNANARIAVIPVNGSTTYTATKYESSSAFGIFECDHMPEYGDVVTMVYIDNTTGTKTHTFTTASATQYVLILCALSSSVSEPKLQLESGSTSMPWSPFENLCPIAGFTGLNLSHSGADTSNPTVIPITWQDEAGTVYGGTLDVTTGVLTVTHKYYENAGTGSWGEVTSGGARYYIGGVSGDSKGDSTNGWCNIGKVVSKFTFDGVVVGSNGRINLCGSLHDAFASTDALKTYLASNPLQVVYELATPITYQLDPVTVNLLLGENNLWHDANGNTELTYYADGNASTQEALGILLGGTYHNPGGDDDATDDEALNILLGG